MARADGVFLYLGTYPERGWRPGPTTTSSRTCTHAGAVGTYDAAVVTKDADGKVHVNKDEMATRHGGWGGAAAGAVIGILFPPSIIGDGPSSAAPSAASAATCGGACPVPM